MKFCAVVEGDGFEASAMRSNSAGSCLGDGALCSGGELLDDRIATLPLD